jgi:hypothetical protein
MVIVGGPAIHVSNKKTDKNKYWQRNWTQQLKQVAEPDISPQISVSVSDKIQNIKNLGLGRL